MIKDEDFFQRKWVIIIIALFCAILWGSAFPTLKISYHELQISKDNIPERLFLAGIRFLLASLILFCGALLFKQKIKISKMIAWQTGQLGFLQTTLQYLFFYTGLAHTSGTKSAILSPGSGPLFLLIVAHFVYKEDKISRKKVIGFAIGILGICIANWGKSSGAGDENLLLGPGFLLLSGLISAFGNVKAKSLTGTLNPIVLSAWQMLFGSSFLLIAGFLSNGYHLHFNLLSMSLLIYSSLLSAVAFALWYTLLQHNYPGQIAMYKFLIPICGSILSIIFLDEKLSFYLFCAVTLVATSIAIVNYSKPNNNLSKKMISS